MKGRFSDRLRRKGAGKELVKEAEELERIAKTVELWGGLDAVRNFVAFAHQWAPVVHGALEQKKKGGEA